MSTPQYTRNDLEKHAEILRVLIRQENDVTNHRTTWLLVTQGILFATVSALIKVHWFPTITVGAFGILTAISIGHALENSYKSRQYLKRTWRERLKENGYKWEDFAPLDGGNPELHPIKALFPWTFIPKTVIAAWALLIIYVIVAHVCAT